MSTAALASRGHNKPPAGFDAEHQAETIRARLTDEHADILGRKKDLLDAIARFPETVEDEETASRTADFIEQGRLFVRKAGDAREEAKKPYLNGGRTVDGFFKGITDPVARGFTIVKQRQEAFLRKKAEEERRRRQEEARRAEEEARAKAAEMQTHEDLDEAVEAAKTAAKATKEAGASAADMSRTRGDYGGVSSLRTYWTFANLDRAKLDLEALRPHFTDDALEKAVRAFIKAGGREIGGVRIFEDTRL